MSSFSPERAAQLHNELLHKAIEHDPSLLTERNLADRLLQVAGVDLGFQQHPLFEFLSLLESTPYESPNSMPGLFTPALYQPDPRYFWHETSELHPDYILLYGQKNYDALMDGGIYISVSTARVIWRSLPDEFPVAERSLPLEVFYKTLLAQWDTGKYRFDSEEKTIAMRWWRDADVDEALSCWANLLSAIERRLPQQGQQETPARLPPLDAETLESLKMGKFARVFLSQAERPGFDYIAPGLTAFSPETLLQIYGSEASHSYRTDLNRFYSIDNFSSLIFPSDTTVPSTTSQSTDWKISSFDKDLGFGKFTVARRAGLYTDCLDYNNADAVRFIHPSGHPDIVDFKTLCPFDRGRLPRLAEVLENWTNLVESQAWDINEHGVETSSAWFMAHTAEAKLDWLDTIAE